MVTTEQLPFFLLSYENLLDHLNSQLDGHTNKVKGEIFADFIASIVPLTDIGMRSEFTSIKLGKASHDEGVDIVCTNETETKILYIQCKLSFKGVDELDTIMSKFENFHKKYHKSDFRPIPLFILDDVEETVERSVSVSFMIATLGKLEKILPLYEKSYRSSKGFYKQLKGDNQIQLLDGPSIWPLLQSAYRKLHILPTDVNINLDMPPLQRDNVYIGIISAKELREIYNEYGDAIFLENIRSFLGVTSGKKKIDANRENVNEAIIETAENQPEKMLARNNGITFRTGRVSKIGERTLKLEDASIVNGCQTTMCLIRSPKQETFVLVKIVETSDSWDIAKAANFQNRVEQIELELASYIRPQALKEIANRTGLHVEDSYKSVFDVFSTIYQDQVAYEEIYYLFIGLFSRSMNNVVGTNYTELRSDLLETIQSQTPLREETFHILFELYKAAEKARKQVEKIYTDQTYRNIFQRFWKENKPNYRAMLTILAASGCTNLIVYERNIDFPAFLNKLGLILENNIDEFINYYQYSFEAVAHYLMSNHKNENEILRAMYEDLKKVKFDNLYRQLRLIADGRKKH